MKTFTQLSLLAALFLAFPKFVTAAEPESVKPPSALTALEESFRDTLTNAEFVGRWCVVKEGELGPEKEEHNSS